MKCWRRLPTRRSSRKTSWRTACERTSVNHCAVTGPASATRSNTSTRFSGSTFDSSRAWPWLDTIVSIPDGRDFTAAAPAISWLQCCRFHPPLLPAVILEGLEVGAVNRKPHGDDVGRVVSGLFSAATAEPASPCEPVPCARVRSGFAAGNRSSTLRRPSLARRAVRRSNPRRTCR